MNIEYLRDHLCEMFPELCPLFSAEYDDVVLRVDAKDLYQSASDLKEFGFDRLGMVTTVDRGETFELVYRLTSRSMSVGIFLKCSVDRGQPVVTSLVSLWPAALWQEREVYDLFGIEFENHPDLRRILLPEDWVGYPLRKDYSDARMVRRPDYV